MIEVLEMLLEAGDVQLETEFVGLQTVAIG